MGTMMETSRALPRLARVLTVDDDRDFAFGLGRMLARHGLEVTSVASAGEALTLLGEEAFDAALLDLGLPDRSGLDLLGWIVERRPRCSVIVITARDEARSAVAALRLGALHYLTKPASFEEIRGALEQAIARREREAPTVRDAVDRGAIGRSPAWRAAVEAIEAAARAPRTQVLFTGESGTGKELAASLLHAWSDRRSGPFVALNSAALSPSLLESELFGHAAGAFTGARGPKRGLLEQASGGTLFLDEIGELPIELQPKLLRVLEGQPFRRVGGDREVSVDVRFVSATNRPLEAAIDAGRFRLDLYHRLRVLDIRLPPLRERGGDVELLAAHFVERFAIELGKPGLTIDRDALHALRLHAWPGNVRELRNVIERAAVLTRTTQIRPSDLPSDVRQAAPEAAPAPSQRGAPSLLRLEDVTRDHVVRTFHACDENVTRAARALGIGRVALRRWLKGALEGEYRP